MDRYKILSLLLPILLIAAAACSSSDDNGDSGNGATATSIPTTTSPVATTTTGSNQPTATVQTAASPVATLPGGATITATDACGLFTKEDAGAALGEAVRDAGAVTVGSQQIGPGTTVSISICTFDSVAGGRSVSITYWKSAGAQATQLRQAIEQIICVGKERVTGLGDFACWNDASHKELQVLKGAGFIDVQITQVSGPDRADALRALAQKALAKLP